MFGRTVQIQLPTLSVIIVCRNTVVVAKLWDSNCQSYRHIKTCKTTILWSFPRVIHKNLPTIFENLEEIDICVPANERFLPYFTCYDFETYFSQESSPGNQASKDSMCC